MRHQGTFKDGKKDGVYTMWFESSRTVSCWVKPPGRTA